MFLNALGFKKCVNRVISKDLFLIIYCPDKYIIQKLCDEAVDDSIATLKLITDWDWFVTSKMVKNISLLFMKIKVYSILMKILVMLYLTVVKQAFLILILIILISITILMKMILILSLLSDFSLGISNLKNANELKIR